MTRLLRIGRERTIESFQGFFTCIGDELASKIVFVCSDMWQPYLKVIREKCSQALHILDRFHIVAKMNLALDDVRAEESRRMKREGRVPVLKKSRWFVSGGGGGCHFGGPARTTPPRVSSGDWPPAELN